MRAFYLKGKALVAMKKHLEAIEVFEEAINSITDNSDGMIALEIRYLYQELMLVVDSEEENEVDNENENLQVESNIVSDNVTDSTGEEVSTVGSVVETPTPPVPPGFEPAACSGSGSGSDVAITDSESDSISSSTSSLSPTSPNRALLLAAHDQLVRDTFNSQDSKITANYLSESRKHLQHITSNPVDSIIDDMIAIGYLQVNTNNHEAAIAIFVTINLFRSDIAAVYLGLGSSYTLTSKFEDAMKAFSQCLAINPTIAEAWKRQGQVLAAISNNNNSNNTNTNNTNTCNDDTQRGRGLSDRVIHTNTNANTTILKSIECFNEALCLAPTDLTIYYERAVAYSKMKSFKMGLADLQYILNQSQSQSQSAKFWNHVGICHSQLGNVSLALEAHRKSSQCDSHFLESYINYAQLCKEAARTDEALEWFARALNVATDVEKKVIVYTYRAHLHYLRTSGTMY